MAKYVDDGIQDGGPVAAINVTSLVDVMFCLLIMFMVATPLMKPQDKVKIDLPQARANEIPEEEFEFLVFSIDAKGEVFLGSTPLSREQDAMVKEISSNTKLKEDGQAFIQGDKNVPYERIVDVLGRAVDGNLDVEIVHRRQPRRGLSIDVGAVGRELHPDVMTHRVFDDLEEVGPQHRFPAAEVHVENLESFEFVDDREALLGAQLARIAAPGPSRAP